MFGIPVKFVLLFYLILLVVFMLFFVLILQSNHETDISKSIEIYGENRREQSDLKIIKLNGDFWSLDSFIFSIALVLIECFKIEKSPEISLKHHFSFERFFRA